MTGKSLEPVLESDTPVRNGAILGYHDQSVNYTDGHHVYIRGPVEANQPLFAYTLEMDGPGYRLSSASNYTLTNPLISDLLDFLVLVVVLVQQCQIPNVRCVMSDVRCVMPRPDLPGLEPGTDARPPRGCREYSAGGALDISRSAQATG